MEERNEFQNEYAAEFGGEEASSVSRRLRDYFDGKIVRKDLTKSIKEGANVPVYVLEFLLGQYCSSDDPTIIEEGVNNVKRILADNYVRPDEAQKILSILRERGAYTVIERQPIIFYKQDLHPVMKQIVLGHELGHHYLHRAEIADCGIFKEFNIFDMRDNHYEYEANVFAAQIMLPDDEILEYIMNGFDISQIASAMCSDINLIALKVAEMNRRGYKFREQEHNTKFLKA